jgi:hypothetical protein
VAFGAATLFTQSIPSQTFATPNLTVGSCGYNLVLDTGQTGPVTPFVNQIQGLVYDCGSSQPAFTTTGTSGFVTVTPTFQVPSGWSLALDTVGDACGGNEATLTSGSPISLLSGSGYEYCLGTSSTSSFNSFTISWTQ